MLVWEIPPQLFMSDSQHPLQPLEGEVAENAAPGQQQHDQHPPQHYEPLTQPSPRRYLELRRRHDEFIECLERYGTNFTANEWPVMAEELGWSVAEVQLYAYEYLTALYHTDDSSSSHVPTGGRTSSSMNGGSYHGGRPLNGNNRAGRRAPMRPWSLEEGILFETLVATYMPTAEESLEDYDWEEVVAAHLPGRSASEVRRRWQQQYGNHPR